MELHGINRLTGLILKSIYNPSIADIEHHLSIIFNGQGAISITGDNKDIVEKLTIFCENKRCYLELIDHRDEYLLRTYFDENLSLEDSHIISIDHAAECHFNTITTDFSLIMKICDEYLSTNDVSHKVMR
jgi:hypothetical protein